ncbi:MAG: SDR family NAD(P)-dependent oxidoreductase [Hamadaea sp.]|uniref:type I polyketide synthase n=1 Tax=Hamadaea sp. TaxID=2024425 RepID=UPI0017ED0ED8|nr:type I polyketide synthase [Hamadaea sp.]NUR70880.1 SDR family NAD(P)-dependent oxidoreductase [Hamadaea sp.]NUT20865.1 SDR family NAD(P)-dependent oxidoreductase [Hamadaea sp.]
MSDSHHIAVVGMAGCFPGAPDIGQYWANLQDAVESITFPSDDELRDYGVPQEMLRNRDYVKAYANAPNVQDFDSALFGYTPREASHTDPQIRMFLESAHAALEHAGYNPHDTDATISVYGAAGSNRYLDLHLGFTGDATAAQSFAITALNNTDYVAITTAYKLDLRGAAISVATACSSSLVAVHLAGQALRNGECDIAVAGGSEVEMPFGHGYLWVEGSPFSRDGHVRPFDVKADGTVFSSGSGAVVLKRLADALADGDTIHAVLRGSAVNNDGSQRAGFTAPSVPGQAAMLAEAFGMAGVTAADLSFIECHATGTPLGDPIEVAALHRALRAVGDVGNARVALGSVKASVGHLGHAAGVASLIKAILALRHGRIPATLNFTEPNPKLELDSSPFVIADRMTTISDTKPWVAGVSSFGVGGTNAHVVVQEAPTRPVTAAPTRPRIVVWSARSEQAGREYQDNLAAYFGDAENEAGFAAAVHTLQRGRRAHPQRFAVIAADAADAAAALRTGQKLITSPGGGRRDVVFAFPGQASQRPGMGVSAYRTDAAFAAAADEVLDLLAQQQMDLRDDWLAADPALLTRTAAAQALLFTVEYATARALLARGVRPAAVIGHSVGELAAAAVAGVFSLPDAVTLVAARGRAMESAPAGAMLAVAMPLDDLVPLLPDGVTVAVVNAERQCVLSGAPEDIDGALAMLRDHKIAATRLNTAGAFHSPLMASAAERFGLAFEGVTLNPPTIPFYSAAAGGLIGERETIHPAFWAEQVAAPVRFDRAMRALLDDGPRLMLETGPDRVLSNLGKLAGVAGSAFIPVLEPQHGLLEATARVWAEGHDVDWDVEGEDLGEVRRVPMPGYPYQRRRHWVEPLALRTPAIAEAAPAASAPTPVDAPPQDTPLSTIVWSEAEPLSEAVLDGHCLLLAPEGEADSLPLVLALQQAGATLSIARPADAYGETLGEFRVRPGERADYTRVLDELNRRGTPPRLVVHAMTMPGELSGSALGGSVDHSFGSLFAVSQVISSMAADAAPGLLVVARGAIDVTGGEQVDPVAAMLVGFAKSLAKEAPQLGCRVVDVRAEQEKELARELARWREHEVVALRGSRRWVAGVRPHYPESAGTPVPASILRRQGHYLITGGTGGLGLALARGLAGTGLRPRLLLVSRTGLADDATDDRSTRLRAQIAELTRLGAQVRVLAADVADKRALQRALDAAVARFGPVNGVFHLAGVPGDGLVRFRDPADAAKVLAPKVRGTVLLAEALRTGSQLDFFACFSSRAATDGLVGSADYAAANAFQDAYAMVLRHQGVPAVSINWPSWAEVGMAADYGVQTWSTELGPAISPILDEHRLAGKAILPGTGQLDLILRGYCAITGRELPVRLNDVVYHLPLAAEQTRRVEIRLHPDGVIELWSRPLDEPGATAIRHTRAKIAPVGEVGEAPDVVALQSTHRHPLDESDADEPRLFRLGPRWNNVTATLTRSEPEIDDMLLSIELPEEFAGDLDEYLIHPSLLDTATTAFRRPADGLHLPFCVESVVFLRRLPMRLFAQSRRLPDGAGVIRADVDLMDPEGRLLVRGSGFTLRKVAGAEQVTGGTAAPKSPGGDSGIDPREGVALTLSILGGDHPGQVLVEPGARPLSTPTAPRVARQPVAPPPAVQVVAQPTPVAKPMEPSAAAPVAPPGDSGSTGVHEGVQTRVKALWVDAIGDPDIPVDANFFEVGGNSLTAISLVGAVRDEFRVELSIGAIFDYPTIAALTDLLWEQGVR